MYTDQQYTIIRSRRRTVAIYIDGGGKVVVRAPLRAPEAIIRSFIIKKAGWIARHLSRAVKHTPHEFLEGELFWFLGQEYPLAVSPDYFRNIRFDDNQFLVSKFSQRGAKPQFTNWYKNQAQTILLAKLEHWAMQMEVGYKSMRITSAKTRWGSCSRKGSINFSWKLIMAPMFVVDYVVVHELAHILQHNHSKNFWLLVNQTYPNWREARDWLNSHGRKLVF